MQSILHNTTFDLQLAGNSPRTVETYSYHVMKFLAYFDKEPKLISEDRIKLYFLFLKYKKKISSSAIAQAICGIKFMFLKTLVTVFWRPQHGRGLANTEKCSLLILIRKTNQRNSYTPQRPRCVQYVEINYSGLKKYQKEFLIMCRKICGVVCRCKVLFYSSTSSGEIYRYVQTILK